VLPVRILRIGNRFIDFVVVDNMLILTLGTLIEAISSEKDGEGHTARLIFTKLKVPC